MIKNAVIKILIADSTITGYVGTKIYPVIAPQETAFPFIVVQKNATTPADVKDGVSPLDEVDFEVDVYSKTENELQSIMSQVRTLLDRYSGTKAGMVIDSITFVNEADGAYEIDSQTFAKSQDYRARINRV